MKNGHHKLYLLFLFVFVALIYSPVLKEHPTLKLDDQELLEPLRKVQSLADYSLMVSQHQVLDVQPVRDFSFWLELKTEDWTGVRNSQAVNLLVWVSILALCFVILEEIAPASPWNLALVLLLAVHPVATTTVAWTAARKHLLSAFFMLLCTLLALREVGEPSRKRRVLILLFFVLSVFSQPISILWPLWLAFLFYQKKQLRNVRHLALLASLTVISLVVAFINLKYYMDPAFALNGPPKMNPESIRNFIHRFLVLGRYVFQLFLPFRPVGLPYGLWRWPSSIGLGLLMVMAAAQIRWHWIKDFKWLVFLLLPILTMTVKLTHHAGYDTYLFASLLGTTFLLGSCLCRRELKKKSIAFLSLLVIVFSVVSFGQARRWTSDQEIFAQGYESEGTEFATVGYAKLLLDSGKVKKASQLIEELSVGDPDNPEIPALKGRTFFLSDQPTQAKEELFRLNEVMDPWYQYYFAAFEASEGHYSEAHKRLLGCFKQRPEASFRAFRGNQEILFNNWRKVCQSAKSMDCSEIDKVETHFKTAH